MRDTSNLMRVCSPGAPNENIVQKPLKHSIVKRILAIQTVDIGIFLSSNIL